MATYTNTGLFSIDATSTDVHRDGSNLAAGAHIWKEIDGVPHPITITYDNGVLYDWVEGHVALNFSNNRSNLSLTQSLK
jgi:hypothetical protein